MRAHLATSAVARQLGVSRSTVLRLVQRGLLRPAHRMPSGALRFDPVEIEAYAAQRATVAVRAARGRSTPLEARAAAPLQRILDLVPAAVGYWDAQLQHVFANQYYRAWFGTTSDQRRGGHSREAMAVALDTPYLEAALRGKAQHVERLFTDAQGVARFAQVSFIPDVEQGVTRGVVMLITDLTARTQREAEHAQLAALVTEADDAIIGKTLSGVITSWNRGAEQLYGYTAAEAVGQPITLLAPPDRQHEIARLLADVARGVGISHYETERVTKAGNRLAVAVTITPLRDKQGEVVGASVIARNITEHKRAAQALRASEERFRALFDRAPVGIAELDLDGRWLRVNQHLCTLLGCTRDEMLQQTFADLTHPEEDLVSNLALITQLRAGEIAAYELEKRYVRPDGETVWATVFVSLVRGDAAPYLVAIITDITTRKRAEAALAASETRFRILVEGAPMGICILDEAGCFEDVNQAYAMLLGYTREELLGQPFALVMAEERRAAALATLRTHLSVGTPTMSEAELRSKDGGTRTALGTGISIQGMDGRPLRAIFAIDITERTRREQETARQASHDTLTGLPNRAYFNGQLTRALASVLPERPLALLLIDLDRFKEVNDTLGHQAGDALLCLVADRLKAALRPADTVARLGGDEFAVVLPNTDEVAAVRVADRLREALDAPLQVAGQTISIDMSAGIALAPLQTADATTLLRFADIAMYAAKGMGGGCVTYQAEQDDHSPSRLGLAAALRRAIGSGELRLHFQPIVDCTTTRVTRMEALVRWQHPTLGLLPPAQFVPLAETLSLITPLTLWVLEEALAQCRHWHDEGLLIDVAVNVAMPTIQDAQFPDLVAALLRRHGLTPSALTVEVTESMLMTRPVEAATAVAALGALGVRVAMDDFGTGQSSLAHLQTLAVTELKIDRFFVQQLARTRDSTLMAFMLGLAGALDCTVVAEGVETSDVWDWLVALGCDTIQGYHISRPLPAGAVVDWLRSYPE